MRRDRIKPHLFSKYFGVNPEALARVGVFDPTLNLDTKLFPDPLLLENSVHPEMQGARASFDHYFDQVRKLLLGSGGDESHVAWRSALRLLSFPEVKGTCLGYGSSSISGSGSGPGMAKRLAKTGYQIVSMGIDDPDLFMAMGLFEEDFGPDLIGDMFTNVCFGDLIAFNTRVLNELGVEPRTFSITLRNGKHFDARLARNPYFEKQDVPIILIPLDILRALPIALDWSGVQTVSAENQVFRDSLNGRVLQVWSRKTLESKAELRDWALSKPSAFGDLLDMVHGMDGKPYDFAGDKLGEIVWRTLLDRIATNYPFNIDKPSDDTDASTISVVDAIIAQFKHLIEHRDLWRELYTDSGQPRLEKAAQRLFYMVAVCYCEANNLDITPEADTGRGPVDFKFSVGSRRRVLVEIKLSKNGQVVHGFLKQLALYNLAERPVASRYIVIDVGNLGKKMKAVEALQAKQAEGGGDAPDVILINGLPRASASKA